MNKGKKFTAAEKYFQKIICSKNKTIKLLTNENYQLIKENEELKSKVNTISYQLEELLKVNNLSYDELKTLIDKSENINKAMGMIGMVGNIGLY